MGETRVQDRKHPHAVFYYLMGDCQYQLDVCQNTPVIFQMIFWFLRGVGAPIFLNNPISGVLILVALFLSTPWIAGGAALGLVVAIVTAMFLDQDRSAIVSGGCTFHGMLCGIVCAASLNGQVPSWQVALIIILLSVISVYVNSGLGAIFGTFGLPALNMPFNLTMFVFLGALGAGNSVYSNVGGGYTSFDALRQNRDVHNYHFLKLLEAIPNSLSAIYGVDRLVSGILILLAMLVNSPITALFAALSSFIAIPIAMLINANPTTIVSGFYSLNAVLTTCAAAGVFWVFSWQNAILSLFAGVFATFTHGLLTRLLIPAQLPALTFAFNIAGFIFMAATSGSPSFKRVPMDEITYPEEHCLKWGVGRSDSCCEVGYNEAAKYSRKKGCFYLPEKCDCTRQMLADS